MGCAVPLGYGIEDCGYVVPKKNGDDCGRSLLAAEAAVVSCGGNGDAEKILVLVNRLYYGTHKEQERLVVFRLSSRFKQIFAGICGKSPVVVLSASVNSTERLFVKKAGKPVAFRHLLHNLHSKLVVVGCKVYIAVSRSKLVLTGGNLVMLCFCIDAELPKLGIKVVHKFGNTGAESTEIVILHFLTLRRL